MKMRVVLAALLGLILCGCSGRHAIEKFTSPSDIATARAYIADLQSRNVAVIVHDLDPSLSKPGVADTIARMSAALPGGPPTSVKVVGVNSLTTPADRVVNITFEYQWGSRWFLANVAVKRAGSVQTIVGLNVYFEKTSLKEQNRFTLIHKSPVQYAILLGAILAVCLTAFVLVLCVRTKGLRRKWLWILFIIFGFGLLSVNWTTGATGYNVFYVSLFSASAFAPLYGPWTISMSLPIGAIVFLSRYRRRLGRGSTEAGSV